MKFRPTVLIYLCTKRDWSGGAPELHTMEAQEYPAFYKVKRSHESGYRAKLPRSEVSTTKEGAVAVFVRRRMEMIDRWKGLIKTAQDDIVRCEHLL